MATITTTTYLDDGTARTAGEAHSINGGTLIIRTDTRWHVGAPASMTGSLGSITFSTSLTGRLQYDGSKVRELQFNTGGGVVPAIGTTITQGGVSGYLLAVYSSLTSAPTAVGAAMPATGWIKFREVTGGTFTAGALTGITATATGADVTSWIEIVGDHASLHNVPRFGYWESVTGTASWYELGTTTGVANQTFQVPTNGGGSGTEVPGVFIETSPGSGVYESYPSMTPANLITTNFGTDIRSKVVCTAGNGLVRIGHNGTTAVGYIPPSGCKVRVPNVFYRQCTTAARATNTVPNVTIANRPEFTTVSAGNISLVGVMMDWYLNFQSSYTMEMKDSIFFDVVTLNNMATPIDVDNICIAPYNTTLVPLTIQNNPLGGTINKANVWRIGAAASGFGARILSNKNLDITNSTFAVATYARTTSSYTLYADYNDDLLVENCYFLNWNPYFSGNTNSTFKNVDYCDRIVGTTNATTPSSGITLANYCVDCVIDGVTLGYNGTIADVHPYVALTSVGTSVRPVVKNIGTYASPINLGSTNICGYLFQDLGQNIDPKILRLYANTCRLNTFLTAITTIGLTIQNVHTPLSAMFGQAINSISRGNRGASVSTTGRSAVYGTHFQDQHSSTTTGVVWLAMNEPTDATDPYVDQVAMGTGAGFTSTGSVIMPNLNDEIIWTMTYYAKGYTAFQNVSPTLTGTNTGNFTYQYQIDINDGNGWNGVWKTISGANLSAETISSTLGFKLKIRIVCSVANASNTLTYVQIPMTTTTVAQAIQYPETETTPTFTLTGLSTGSTVVIFDTSWNELSRGTVAVTSYAYDYNWNSDDGDFDVNILIWKDDKVTIKTSTTLTDVDQTLPISQQDDLVYVAAVTPNFTIDYGNTLLIMDAGATTYNVPEVYSAWKDDILLTNNAQYDFAFTQLGGNTVSGATSVADYVFINSVAGWSIRPDEADHTLSVTNGILVSNNETDPFVDTVGAYTVRIRYEQPVQVLALTSGSTPADVWSYSTRELSTTGVSAIKSGLATKGDLAALD